jgi:hypothetical protein
MNNATVSDTFKPMNMEANSGSLLSDSKSLLPTLSNSSNSSTSSIWEYIQSISFTTWLVVFLLLALIGFNIFAYLAKGTQSINEIFGPIFHKLLVALGMTASQTVDVAATGTKTVVNTTANVTDAGLTNVQKVLPTSNEHEHEHEDRKDISQNNAKNRALNTQKAASIGSTNSYQEDDATSNIQMGSAKSGYCYIGEDRGYRSCAYVGESDKCISGEIFPTNEICINPNLRT